MGYMHIENLYKNQDILLFKQCYAMEKIHGTSAHIFWSTEQEQIVYFSGGEKYEKFVSLFDETKLKEAFIEKLHMSTIFFGEAYGGKQQAMSDTYGKELKFIVFDVKVGEHWLDVPKAESLALSCGFEFVPYERVSTDLTELDAQRDATSIQAKRNGIMEDKVREGVVLHPLIQLKKNNGSRIIAKHKNEAFRETTSIRKVKPEKEKIMNDANAIADEWVTLMRMQHVLDKLGNPLDVKSIPDVIKAVVEDVCREAEGEIEVTKTVKKAIGSKAAKLYKEFISLELHRRGINEQKTEQETTQVIKDI